MILCDFLRWLAAKEHDHSSWVDGAPPRDRVKDMIAQYIATRTMGLFQGRKDAVWTRAPFCQQRHKELSVYCTRRAQDFSVQKLEGHRSDLSASSGSISQPLTRRSEPEANLFRIAPRHPSNAGGQETNFQDQQAQEDMVVEDIWVPRAAL